MEFEWLKSMSLFVTVIARYQVRYSRQSNFYLKLSSNSRHLEVQLLSDEYINAEWKSLQCTTYASKNYRRIPTFLNSSWCMDTSMDTSRKRSNYLGRTCRTCKCGSYWISIYWSGSQILLFRIKSTITRKENGESHWFWHFDLLNKLLNKR